MYLCPVGNGMTATDWAEVSWLIFKLPLDPFMPVPGVTNRLK